MRTMSASDEFDNLAENATCLINLIGVVSLDIVPIIALSYKATKSTLAHNDDHHNINV